MLSAAAVCTTCVMRWRCIRDKRPARSLTLPASTVTFAKGSTEAMYSGCGARSSNTTGSPRAASKAAVWQPIRPAPVISVLMSPRLRRFR